LISGAVVVIPAPFSHEFILPHGRDLFQTENALSPSLAESGHDIGLRNNAALPGIRGGGHERGDHSLAHY